jgi:hypothetical protein
VDTQAVLVARSLGGERFPVEADARCSKCGVDLHSCVQCVSFDTGARFECTQPLATRVALVTQAYHMRRAEGSLRKQNIDVVPAPFPGQGIALDPKTGAPLTGAMVTGQVPNAGGGWPFVLSDLKTLLETGRTLPDPYGAVEGHPGN